MLASCIWKVCIDRGKKKMSKNGHSSISETNFWEFFVRLSSKVILVVCSSNITFKGDKSGFQVVNGRGHRERIKMLIITLTRVSSFLWNLGGFWCLGWLIFRYVDDATIFSLCFIARSRYFILSYLIYQLEMFEERLLRTEQQAEKYDFLSFMPKILKN